ncbi:MAG: helix-turn-helix transcriptional regulator [Roseitalea sp.]|jgi:mRNA interferase RelE/StbE|nr:helix-turn-helix transcriptional regulator [Oceaniradius stylonematis]MBO6553296.1 helix-turn-helix transcriptional regulator [Roseitalea sp.]MBO6950944.1 helix-turn-helix transcriptional regulator [Rhizobiaceae bacterium]MBO6591069.1 helix-turn-helix transcriptional regulator [Roseitalea sp.]MBO6599673.1 helix-turn-helix transcriptional regulator [Roseitalea sp.]MBO6613924.1 helix-turn-helix transcriptional regulator [Roseitalea sp.]
MDDMKDTVTIPRAEYEALIAARDDHEDMQAVADHLADPQEGLPHELMKRLIDGESPLSVYRQWRGFNQSSLSRASGVNRVQIADIEAGRSKGSVATLKKLAEALNVSIDDLV